MDTIITEPATKRMRNGSVILTDRMCEKRVAKRVKFYDRKCPGLYVSITTAGVATFSFKFTDPATGLSCHRRRQVTTCQLDTSVGVSGPHVYILAFGETRRN